MTRTIPVIDLFSGPGGLSEGFSRFGEQPWSRLLSPLAAPQTWEAPKNLRFKIALSIEKDAVAHQTLRLRSFTRQFDGRLPAEYYEMMRGERALESLYAKFPKQYALADNETWCQTLGNGSPTEVDARIRKSLKQSALWCLIGGPPCQAYSLAGRSRNKGIEGYVAEEDERHFLYKEYLRIVSEHSPTVFVMENVQGILSSKINGTNIFTRIIEDLSNAGSYGPAKNKSIKYDIHPLAHADAPDRSNGRQYVLKSEDLGIPQARHRVILVGIRRDQRAACFQVGKLGYRSPVAIEKVLDGLPRLRARASHRQKNNLSWEQCLNKIVDERWYRQYAAADVSAEMIAALARFEHSKTGHGAPFVRGGAQPKYMSDWFSDPALDGVSNHEARSHMPSDLHRYFFAACFGRARGRSPTLADFPRELLPKHKNANTAADEGALFSDRFRVQVRGRPATTITSHISKDGHYYIHHDPAQCRALTVREAARIQTFPDNYFFCGSRTEQFHQVGNAVPPLLSVQIAGSIAHALQAFVSER